ncbi:hypothetical protein IM25_04615 [Rhodococcus sp. p52]|nr:hypothetical protein IM25_04615 [Rhodococcus sp. p52]
MTGVVQFRERDGTPKEQAYSGRIASTIKDLGLKAAMAGLRVEALRPGAVGFPRVAVIRRTPPSPNIFPARSSRWPNTR